MARNRLLINNNKKKNTLFTFSDFEIQYSSLEFIVLIQIKIFTLKNKIFIYFSEGRKEKKLHVIIFIDGIF